MTYKERRGAAKQRLREIVDEWKAKYGYRPPKQALEFLENKPFITAPATQNRSLEYWEGVCTCHTSQIEKMVIFLTEKGKHEESCKVG